MPHRLSLRGLGLCAVALAPWLILTSASAADEFAVSPAQMQALGVQLQRLDKPADIAGQTFPARVTLPPRQDRVVSAPLAGVVEQLLASEDDSVKPGQPLLRLASPELGELQQKLMESASRGRLSARTLQRERLLFAEGIVPERRVHEAESAAAEDSARQRQAEAALRQAGLDEAAIRRVGDGGRAETTLTLRTRAAGLVTELKVRPGQRVAQGDALMHIADTRRLWLEIQIPLARQRELAQARGTPVRVTGREVRASVAQLGAMAADNQTLTLRADVTQGTALLRVGEFVQVEVPFAATATAAAAADGWPVPLQAVMREGDKAYLLVRTAKGFVATPVTVLASAGQAVRVKGDLQAGQEYASSAVIALKAAWQGKGGGK